MGKFKDAVTFIGAALLLAGALWWSVHMTNDLLNVGNPFADHALTWGKALCEHDYETMHRMGFRIFGKEPRPVEFDAVVESYLAKKIGRGEFCTPNIFYPTTKRIPPPPVVGVSDEAWLVEIQLTSAAAQTHLFVRVVKKDDGSYYISPDEAGLEAISRWDGWVYREPLDLDLFGTYGGSIHFDPVQVLQGETIWAVGIPYILTGGGLKVKNLNVRALNAHDMTAIEPLTHPLGQIEDPRPVFFALDIAEERRGTWWFTMPTPELPERILLEMTYDGQTITVEPVLPPPDRHGALGPYPLSVVAAHVNQDAEGGRVAVFSFQVDESLILPSRPFDWECGDFQLRWEESDIPRSSDPLDCSQGQVFYAALDGGRTLAVFNLRFQAAPASVVGDLDVTLYGIDDWSEAPNAFQRALYEGVLRPEPVGQTEPMPLTVTVEPFAQDVGNGSFVAIFNMQAEMSLIRPDSYFRWSCENFQLAWQENGTARTGIAALCPEGGDIYFTSMGNAEFRLALEAPGADFADADVTLLFSEDWTSPDARKITLYEGKIRHD